MNKFLVFVASGILLAGCGEKIYDSEYYAEHVDEAKAVVEKCRTGQTSGDNCTNARNGIDKHMFKSAREKLKE